MERLTARNERFPDETYYPYCFREDTCGGEGMSDKCDMCEFPIKICKRLAAYEDTGLTPEQICSIATELKEYKQIGLSPKRLSEHVAFCKRYHQLFGAIDFNHLMELKERDMAKKPVQTEEGMICPACGSKAFPWSRFCDECGQRWWEE